MQMNSRKRLDNARVNEQIMDRRDMLRTAGAVAVAGGQVGVAVSGAGARSRNPRSTSAPS